MALTYHRIAYEGVVVANPVTLEAVETLSARTGLGEGAVALDIGAGAGGVSVALAKRLGLEVHAMERDPAMAEMIRARAEAEGASDRVTVHAETSASALDRLAPADLIVALGTTEPAGPGVRDPAGIIAGLAGRLASPGWLLWGDMVWKGDPPEPLRQVIGLTGDYADDAGWRAAGEAAGLELVEARASPQEEWDAFFEGADARVRSWLAANPDAPEAAGIRTRADQIKAMFDYGKPWIGFGLYLWRKG